MTSSKKITLLCFTLLMNGCTSQQTIYSSPEPYKPIPTYKAPKAYPKSDLNYNYEPKIPPQQNPDVNTAIIKEMRKNNCLASCKNDYQIALAECNSFLQSDDRLVERDRNMIKCLTNKGFPNARETCDFRCN